MNLREIVVVARRRRRLTRAEKLAEQHRWKLSLLRSFIAKHGWSALRNGTVVPPGVDLYNYVHLRRRDYHHGRRGKPIARWLVEACEAIPGWSWDPLRDQLQRAVDTVRAFVRQHGWDAVTRETVIDGVALVQWCSNRRGERRRGKLQPWLVRALESIPGWSWDPKTSDHALKLRALRDHLTRHGWAGVRQKTISRDGVAIGRWVNYVRTLHRDGRVPRWLEVQLVQIDGWTWEPARDRQAERIALVRRLYARRGPGSITRRTVAGGIAIGEWLSNVRQRHRSNLLSRATRRALESIPGWSWKA